MMLLLYVMAFVAFIRLVFQLNGVYAVSRHRVYYPLSESD